MRRVSQILFNALTALSLLLCLASAGLWVRGYLRWDTLGWAGPARPGVQGVFGAMASAGGTVAIRVGRHGGGSGSLEEGGYWKLYEPGPNRFAAVRSANRWGFGYESAANSVARWRGILFPAWVAVFLFALAPGGRLGLFVRRRRPLREGHCRACGYDLRATPERCPECGAIPRS